MRDVIVAWLFEGEHLVVRLEAVFGVEVDVAGRACSCGVLLAHLAPALLHS